MLKSGSYRFESSDKKNMPMPVIRKDFLFTAIKRLLDFGIVFYFILIVFIIVTGGFSKHFLGIKISAKSIENPILFISLFVFIRFAISLKIKDFLLLVGSVLLCFFAIEIFLRVWNPPIARPALLQIHRESPIFGWELIPNVSGVGKLGTNISINSYGLRDTENQLKKDKEVYRIMAVGDSFTFGMGVSLEDTFSKQLETLLNYGGKKSEVINCGVIGYIMWQNFEVLKHKVLPFNPDLVILAVFLNDIHQSSHPSVSNPEWKPKNPFIDKSSNNFKNKVNLYNIIRNIGVLYRAKNRYKKGQTYLEGIDKRKKYIDDTQLWHKIMYGKLEEQKYSDFSKTFDKFVSATNTIGSKLVVIMIPDASQLHEPEKQHINRFVEHVCIKNDIPFIDATPLFEIEEDPNSLFLFPFDPHTSPKGHRIIAELLEDKISAMLK